jgi:hypothetical protein
MHTYEKRKKLTVTVDKSVIEEAHRSSKEKGVPISRAIENYLKFFAQPEVYCFKCGEKVSSKKAQLCPKCGWMKCPTCGACRCGLDEDTAVAIFHMRRVYEDLLAGRVKQS